MAQNNIEAYQGSLQGSQQANNVLQLDIKELQKQNDKLLKQIDSVRIEKNIKPQNVHTAATQTQTLLVSIGKDTEGDLTDILKDSIYTDTIQYNKDTYIYYSIMKDSVWVSLDVKNTQYLYIYQKREYKNKKNFLKRLLTLDFKKVNTVKYDITNTNPVFDVSNVRVIENTK